MDQFGSSITLLATVEFIYGYSRSRLLANKACWSLTWLVISMTMELPQNCQLLFFNSQPWEMRRYLQVVRKQRLLIITIKRKQMSWIEHVPKGESLFKTLMEESIKDKRWIGIPKRMLGCHWNGWWRQTDPLPHITTESKKRQNTDRNGNNEALELVSRWTPITQHSFGFTVLVKGLFWFLGPSLVPKSIDPFVFRTSDEC